MYKVGDKIVYPTHGAGIIDEIISREVQGQNREYYVMYTHRGNIKLMIPADKCDEIGVRPVIKQDEIVDVLSVLKDESTEMSANWNRRYRANMDKLKTGDIFQVAEVTRNLYRVEQEKKLSNGEKKMLASALDIMESEFMLVINITEDEAEKMICEVI